MRKHSAEKGQISMKNPVVGQTSAEPAKINQIVTASQKQESQNPVVIGQNPNFESAQLLLVYPIFFTVNDTFFYYVVVNSIILQITR